MYFCDNTRRKPLNDMHKSTSNVNFDQLNQNQNRLCKGICNQFRASRPSNGDRYASGQYRCQVCEIFLMEQGVNNLRCKCCNFQVRSRPRNSFYKDKYHEKIKIIDELQVKQESDEKINEEIIGTKKSTPIYEELDDSVKTYYEFKEFLDSTMRLEANYQLVMLKELLEYGRLHIGEIADSLAYFNNKDSSDITSVKYYLHVPVYDVLAKHGFVTIDYDNQIPYYTLNVKLTEMQKTELSNYLINNIEKYNRDHNIPDNEYPNANNVGSIDWDDHIELMINQKTENLSTGSILLPVQIDDDHLTKDQSDKNIQQIGEKESIDIKPDIESQDFKSVKIFESHNDSVNIKHCKVVSTEIIQKEQHLTNDEIVRIFGVGNMGGIRYSSKNNVIILCDTQSTYDDKFNKDFQIIQYAGEGRKGDQTLTGGNQRIVNSETTPIFYFIEVPQEPGQKRRGALDNVYKFVGQVKYTKHVFKTENDVNGVPRQVIKFLLEIK